MPLTGSDKRLGMNRAISRRDFLEGSLKYAAGTALAGAYPGALGATPPGMKGVPQSLSGYPPQLAGLRGSHAGSFEAVHQLAWEGRKDWGAVHDAGEDDYDLVVVGAGVSGLSAAWFYREQHPDARILILDNHDDFGGHAKRNEFQWGDRTILGYGGSQSLEAPSAYSDVAKGLLQKLGIDLKALAATYDQDFYRRHNLGSTVYFDREHYGTDLTLRSQFVDASLFLPLAESGLSALEAVDRMPVSDEAKSQLRHLMQSQEDVLPDHSLFSEPDVLGSISYEDFISRAGVNNQEVIQLLRDLGSSYFGHGTDMVPAIYALGFGLPGLSGTSLGTFKGLIERVVRWTTEPYIYHFPDGNASVARLLVRSLIPAAAPGSTMQDIVTAPFDYAALDTPDSPVRLRLSSMVINVEHDGPAATARQVDVTYLQGGKAHRVRGRQVVLACYNMAIPHICPGLPDNQKAALAKLVKVPMCSTNVLLKDWHALKSKGIGMVYSPGRWNKTFLVDFPVTMGDYHFVSSPDDPIMLHCLRGVTGSGETPEEQSRNGRHELLGLAFEDYERELRQHLAGMLGDTDFDPARDISAITVNRWPHGYAWNPNPLFNPAYDEGLAPHELGRQPFGRITIANSDAGARAYLDCAIDEAYRAVGELT